MTQERFEVEIENLKAQNKLLSEHLNKTIHRFNEYLIRINTTVQFVPGNPPLDYFSQQIFQDYDKTNEE